MTQEEITQALDRIAETQNHQTLLREQMTKLMEEAIPPEVKKRMDEISTEFGDQIRAASTNITELEAAVKDGVKALGQSVKGKTLHAVYSKGRVSWDNKALEGYLVAHHELAPPQKRGRAISIYPPCITKSRRWLRDFFLINFSFCYVSNLPIEYSPETTREKIQFFKPIRGNGIVFYPTMVSCVPPRTILIINFL